MIFASNKKAYFEYEVLERFEAGLVLSGPEVKSVRTGGAKLTGGYAAVRGTTATLINVHISRYRFSSPKKEYDPTQTRRLLLHEKEMRYLEGKTQEQGLTIVPLSLYSTDHKIKVELGLVRGKKRFDKRRATQQRDIDRDTKRTLKHIARTY